jgi:hypothetical protein
MHTLRMLSAMEAVMHEQYFPITYMNCLFLKKHLGRYLMDWKLNTVNLLYIYIALLFY